MQAFTGAVMAWEGNASARCGVVPACICGNMDGIGKRLGILGTREAMDMVYGIC